MGFSDREPLQVWDLAKGVKLRDFCEVQRNCVALTHLLNDRVAVSCKVGSDSTPVIAIYDVKSGKQKQRLTGHSDTIFGLAHIEEHIVSASWDGMLCVWSEETPGEVGIDWTYVSWIPRADLLVASCLFVVREQQHA